MKCKKRLHGSTLLPRGEAIAFMEERGEPYKVELINDLPEDAVISFYKQGEFTDLCAGPHVDSTGRIKGNAVKLTACNAELPLRHIGRLGQQIAPFLLLVLHPALEGLDDPRALGQDDGQSLADDVHGGEILLILRPEQLEEEFKGCLDLAKYCLGTVSAARSVTGRNRTCSGAIQVGSAPAYSSMR